jgi:hypothetical protein
VLVAGVARDARLRLAEASAGHRRLVAPTSRRVGAPREGFPRKIAAVGGDGRGVGVANRPSTPRI